jgi:hypothetical protein
MERDTAARGRKVGHYIAPFITAERQAVQKKCHRTGAALAVSNTTERRVDKTLLMRGQGSLLLKYYF